MRRRKPEGYKELLVYKRANELQDFVYTITENFSLNERRRKEHMRDSARSVKQNIVEGWKRETTQQYIDFLMGRLKSALERKIGKEEVLSPYDRWLGKEMEKKQKEEKKADEELKEILKKEGKIFTIEGVISMEEAERRGLKEIS